MKYNYHTNSTTKAAHTLPSLNTHDLTFNSTTLSIRKSLCIIDAKSKEQAKKLTLLELEGDNLTIQIGEQGTRKLTYVDRRAIIRFPRNVYEKFIGNWKLTKTELNTLTFTKI